MQKVIEFISEQRINSNMDRVCSSCFEDPDIRAWIRNIGGPRGCDFCGRYDSPTAEVDDVCSHIEKCLRKYWGFAVDQLPYETAEGGYQGQTWYTDEVLFDEEGLALPRDNGTLREALVAGISDELWCEWDWLTLDDDVSLRLGWEKFCENIKHRRRFFFQQLGRDVDDRDSYSPEGILRVIADSVQDLGLIREFPAGSVFWRARGDISRGMRTKASDFGPPPRQRALQSNRMNPAGIPVMYAASSAQTAKAEARAPSAVVGKWTTLRPARILDFRRLPKIPGTFSDATRQRRFVVRFLHHFCDAIMSPVDRDDRVHIDYLPSQVASEFFRDFSFDGGVLDGIAYGSTVYRRGWNIALFVEPADLGLEDRPWYDPRGPWLEFQHSIRV